MKSSCHSIGLLFAVCCLLATLSRGTPLAAAITVQTADGRELSGEVDEQTDDRLLWVRQQSEQISLSSSVPWASIVAATQDGKNIPLTELPKLLHQRTKGEPLGFVVEPVAYYAPSNCQGECLPVVVTQNRKPARKPQVRSLRVDAFLVNFDQDAEPDGLRLIVAALDERGVPVPVRGNLYVRLWGERMQSHGSLIRFEALQKWSQPVASSDFSEGVASYALRFRTVEPEFDFGLRSEALVHVRLGVFGQGNFAASVPVQIRSFNPFRDQWQLHQGSHSFRSELTRDVGHLARPSLHIRRPVRSHLLH